jgi:hypothetical protein
MEMTFRGLVTALHGMLFGAFFLLAVFGVVVELSRQIGEAQPAELSPRAQRIERLYLIVTVVLGWAAVLTGAYVVYPWYRALPPAGAGLSQYPQALLKSSSATAGWHFFGMEWKEHVAWFAPMAMTMAASILIRCRRQIEAIPQLRTALLIFVLAAFGSAGIAGFFGAMINKHAPVEGGPAVHLLNESQP